MMLLGQPTTETRLEAGQRARAARNAAMVREMLDAVARGALPRDAALAAARRHKLSRGGAQFARELYAQEMAESIGPG